MLINISTHCVQTLANPVPTKHFMSTFFAGRGHVTRRKSGACAILDGPYLGVTATIDAELIRGCVVCCGLGGSTGEGERCLVCRDLSDPGGQPARAVGASRALQPPRSGASGCSAEDRSATRSELQRSHG